MPAKANARRLAEPVITAIEQCSVSRPVWHLDATERWKVIRDVLLGHPEVRGRLRPRDLPVDTSLREMTGGVAALHNCEPAMGDESYRYTFGEWLYSFAVLLEPTLDSSQADSTAPPVAHQALYECFREIRKALQLDEKGEYWKTCPILHRLIGAVGWSAKDWTFIKRYLDHECDAVMHELVATARLTARASRSLGVLGDLNGADRARLAVIRKPTLRLMTVKTQHVQKYLCRGKYHWLMRGASAWCAQVLAFIRDEIPAVTPGALLLSDSDVGVAFLVPADAVPDAESVMAQLWENFGSREFFLRRFPRLSEVAAVRDLADIDPRTAFPDISIHLSKPTSLLELCTPRPASAAQREYDDEEKATRRAPLPNTAGSGEPCSYVEGEFAITSSPPAWLEVRGDNRGGKVTEYFGFQCLVWSLCGTTMKAHWFQNAARAVVDVTPGVRMLSVHHGEWLKWLRATSTPLCFLKLDGDGVGNLFKATPIPRRPYLSMELCRLVLERVINATRRVMAQQSAATNLKLSQLPDEEKMQQKQRHPAWPFDGADIPLAADMVYVGGDDIFFCLPQDSMATFLAGFSEPTRSDYPAELRELRFKFVSVTLPVPSTLDSVPPAHGSSPSDPLSVDAKSELMQQANRWASQLAGDELKEVAKREGMARVSEFEKIKAGWEHTYGFDCTIWQPDLVPHGAPIDEDIVHGVHVRLLPGPA